MNAFVFDLLERWQEDCDRAVQHVPEVATSGMPLACGPCALYPDYAPLGAVRDASSTIFCVETLGWPMFPIGNHICCPHSTRFVFYGGADGVHNGGINMTFSDSHARWVNARVMAYDDGTLFKNPRDDAAYGVYCVYCP